MSRVGSLLVQKHVGAVLAHARTDQGQRQLRFASVSAIAILVSTVTLGFCYGVLGWDGKHSIASQFAAFVTSTIASYVLNRRWVFGKSGRSDFVKEVLPFWSLGAAQLAISIPFFQWGRSVVEDHFEAKLVRLVLVLILNLTVYGVMWVGKYVFFDRVLFADRTPTAE
jgi:putative flippase GtrA